jgi:RecA-family ATPase
MKGSKAEKVAAARLHRPSNAAGPDFITLVRDGAEIYNADFPEPEPIVRPILYRGLTLLAGKPKAGKSWLALDLAISIVQERKFAGYLEIQKPSRVLYISLEERARQTRARMRLLTPYTDFLHDLRFIHELPPLLGGGAEALDAELRGHPCEVIIIDSLLAISRGGGRRNVDAVQADYDRVNALRQIAERHKSAMVVICHTRKAAAEDVIDSLQTTGGTTAAADGVWVLQKKADGCGVLHVTGREDEERIYGLKRDGPRWVIRGEGEEFTQTEERREILDLLRENGAMKPRQLARDLAKRVPAVQKLLRSLVDEGLICRKRYGEYQLIGA